MSLSLEQTTALCRLLAKAAACACFYFLEAHELDRRRAHAHHAPRAEPRVDPPRAPAARGLVQQRRERLSRVLRRDACGPRRRRRGLWQLLREQLTDAQARVDREHASEVIRARKRAQSWAESVAGRMERHYSPGRTWEATAHALIDLLELGDVLDIACGDGVLAELLSGHARSITAGHQPTLIAAARERLKGSAT